MTFDSLATFMAMDGHGVYIWTAYAITCVVIAINLWWPGRVRRGFVQVQKRALEREQQREAS